MIIRSRIVPTILEGNARIFDKAIFSVELLSIGSVLSIRGMKTDNTEVELGTITTSGALATKRTFTIDLDPEPMIYLFFKIISIEDLVSLDSCIVISKSGSAVMLST